eukprot:1159425-Pelagomonas_calceolata.AAC.4
MEPPQRCSPELRTAASSSDHQSRVIAGLSTNQQKVAGRGATLGFFRPRQKWGQPCSLIANI